MFEWLHIWTVYVCGICIPYSYLKRWGLKKLLRRGGRRNNLLSSRLSLDRNWINGHCYDLVGGHSRPAYVSSLQHPESQTTPEAWIRFPVRQSQYFPFLIDKHKPASFFSNFDCFSAFFILFQQSPRFNAKLTLPITQSYNSFDVLQPTFFLIH